MARTARARLTVIQGKASAKGIPVRPEKGSATLPAPANPQQPEAANHGPFPPRRPNCLTRPEPDVPTNKANGALARCHPTAYTIDLSGEGKEGTRIHNLTF